MLRPLGGKHLAWLICVAVALATTTPTPAALVWEQLPPLPNELGLGGAAVGVHRGALIVAGGTNFPDAHPAQGGAKEWYDQIYVLTQTSEGQAAPRWIDAGRLPKRLAYAATVSTDAGVVLIGGDSDGQPVPDVYRLVWDRATSQVVCELIGKLPRPATNLAAGLIGSTIYVVGADRSRSATSFDRKMFWSLDLSRANQNLLWRQDLPRYPGRPRQQAVTAVQAQGDGRQQLFVVSGMNAHFRDDGSPDLARYEHFTDAYRFDPATTAWTRIADLPIVTDPRPNVDSAAFAAERWPVVAGVGVGLGQSHIAVFSGSTGRYVTRPVDERPAFANTILAYHTITDRWTTAGAMPRGVVTTGIAQWGARYVIPTGEVRPGVRTNQVQAFAMAGLTTSFGVLNYVVLALYLLGVLAVGAFFATRTKSTDDFFRGGQRVPFWVAGFSIFATMLSSITFVALPAKAFATNWEYYPAQLTIFPIALIVTCVAIPFFRGIDATSAYEYLQRRFNLAVRMLASAQFVLFQLARMAIVMYLPALALAAITPFSVVECIVVMGLLSVLYCTLGGVEAVVWTDAVQTIVLLGGLVFATVVVALQCEGGVAGMVATAADDGKFDMLSADFAWGSWSRTAIWVVVVGQLFASLYSYTADQAVVQRYLTTSDERGARKAMWTTAWMGAIGSSLFFVMGTALYVFYKSQPDQLDLGMKNDAVFPLFIATQLPVGIAGLVIAGIFAAAQSTISTSMNSTATAVVTDFCMPLGMCGTDRGYLRLARLVTALLGVGGTLVACWLAQVGNAMAIDAFIAVIGLFGGAVSGVFMLGMLTRRANVAGAMIGSILGFAAVLWTMYDRSINIHPFLYAAIGTVTTVVAGYLASLLARPLPPSRLAGLTIFDRHHN